MTDRMDEIRAREQAATDGPWFQGREWRSNENTRDVYSKREPDEPDSHDIASYIWSAEDANLIANAPADLAYLLARVATLEAQVAAVREVHAEGEFGCPCPSHGCNDFYYRGNYCPDAGTSCEACGEKYPCPTIRALGGDS